MPFKHIEDKRAWGRRYARTWRKNNLDRALIKERAAGRKLRRERPEQVKIHKRTYYTRNKLRLAPHWKQKRDSRKTAKAEYDKQYGIKNRAKKKAYLAAWFQANKQRQNLYCRMKRATDPQYRIANNLRCRMNTALRNVGLKRDKPLEVLLGCTVEFLMGYLEAQFKEGMTWDNRSKWDVDHIRPCAKFDLTLTEERTKCFHYSNLQPLWKEDNVRKSDRWQAEG